MKANLTREQRAFRQELVLACYRIIRITTEENWVLVPGSKAVYSDEEFVGTLKATQDELGSIIDEVSTGEGVS